MTTNQIKKLLELLKANKFDELKEELTTELLRGTDKKSASLFSAIKKYLKHSATINKYRPVLKTIMHRNNKQFILDGFSAYIFENYLPELDNLPNTKNEDNVIHIEKIMIQNPVYSPIQTNDLLLLKNIKKYIAYFKLNFTANEELTNQIEIPLFWNNAIYDAKRLEQTAEIMLFEDLQITTGTNQTQLKTQTITGLVLPLRIFETNKVKAIKNFTNQFIEQLDK